MIGSRNRITGKVAWVTSGKHAFSVRNTHVKEGNYLLQLIRPTDATIEHGNCLI